jgi:glycerol-3-phosphate acyltransferase PlsX
VRGVCIIGHGSSNDRAIYNGIRVAYESAKGGTIQSIEAEFASRPKVAAPTAGPEVVADAAAVPGVPIL